MRSIELIGLLRSFLILSLFSLEISFSFVQDSQAEKDEKSEKKAIPSENTIEKSESPIQKQEGSPVSYGMTFLSDHYEKLPLSRSLWQILEVLEPSTYTNFIDVAGLKGGWQPLIGIHGSSWTQNTFLLNGMDLTDPYDGGRALFIPDFGSVERIAITTGAHPIGIERPGGAIDIMTKTGHDPDEGNRWEGSLQSYYLNHVMQSSEKSFPEVRGSPPFMESFSMKARGEFQMDGVIEPRRIYLFAAATSEENEVRIKGYDGMPEISLKSGFFSMDFMPSAMDRIKVTLSAQRYEHSEFSAHPLISREATVNKKDQFQTFQILWDRDPQPSLSLNLKSAYACLDTGQRLNGASQSSEDLWTGQRWGSAPYQDISKRRKWIIQFQGRYRKDPPDRAGGTSQKRGREGIKEEIQFGCEVAQSFIDSSISAIDDLNLVFYKKAPLAVKLFNTPLRSKEKIKTLSFYISDTIPLTSRILGMAGVRWEWSRGYLPSQQSPAGSFSPERIFPSSRKLVDWKNLSPRMGIVIPLTADDRLLFKAILSRYHHRLLGRHLEIANPNALGGKLYSWSDANRDGQYQPEERGPLLKAFGSPETALSGDLQQPFTDEFLFGLELRTKKKSCWKFFAYQRDEHRLLETVNVGIPFSSYTPVEIFDLGDDERPETGDEQTLIVFNQDPSTFGQDRYLLENPSGHHSYAQGFEITGEGKGPRFWWLYSFVVARSVGRASPGNTEFENDQGVIGELYDHPNAMINARGRLFFDRAFTSRFAFACLLPRDWTLGTVIRWWDGLPFGRRLLIEGLNQGPVIIQSRKRGLSRTEAYLTVDLGIKKSFRLKRGTLILLLDIFNLFNSQFHLRENDRAGPNFTDRLPVEVMAPRIIRLGIKHKF